MNIIKSHFISIICKTLFQYSKDHLIFSMEVDFYEGNQLLFTTYPKAPISAPY